MRFSAIAMLAILAAASVSCTPEQTPAVQTSANVPAETQVSITLTPTAALPTDTPTGPLGSISGNIRPVAPNSGPTGTMRIGAREINSGRVTLVDIPDGQSAYTIAGLPVGTYMVFGWVYPDGVTGAYTSTVIATVKTSAEQMTCNNSILTIDLAPDTLDVTGVDIGCWAGDYFSYLTPIP
jgi:hypothetical protein